MMPASPCGCGPAIAAGYGVNLKTMLLRGIWLTAILWVLVVAFGYLAWRFWPGFGVA